MEIRRKTLLRRSGIAVGLASLLLAGAACQRQEEPPPPPPPTPRPSPTPIPTPHPALGAQEAARRLYPDLAKADSLFHLTFMEVFEDERVKHPLALTTVDWPLDVARRTAEILNIHPGEPATPPPPRVVVVRPTAPPTPRTLDRRPYEQHRSIYPHYYPFSTPIR